MQTSFSKRRSWIFAIVGYWLLSCYGSADVSESGTASLSTAAAQENADSRQSEQLASEEDWSLLIKPFLKTHCNECHSGSSAEAGIDFEFYTAPQQLHDQRPRWDQIRGIIKIGAMPPVDHSPQPTPEQRKQVAEWIDRYINTVDCQSQRDAGRVTLRRLNSVEYDNTIRDLLAIEGNFAPSQAIGFPSDDVGNGFDNQGEVLGLSQLQIEKYMEAAATIARRALAPAKSFQRRSFDLPPLFLGDRQAIQARFLDGTYEIKTRLQFAEVQENTAQVHLMIDEVQVDNYEVHSKRDSFTSEVTMTAGWHKIELHFASDSGQSEKKGARRVEIESVNIQGPPPIPESYSRVIRLLPDQNKTAVDAARENLAPIMRRAYRRQVEAGELDRVVNIVTLGLEKGFDFEQSMAAGLQAILVSPHFLFRVEKDSPGQALNSWALASRLSYFIWASMPDDRLLDLAEENALLNTQVLQAEALRMLRDPKSGALAARFFGQLFGLGNLASVTPDEQRFPLWNNRLRESLSRETELFCQEIIQQDLPISTLINADFTFVNPRLAELYGMEYQSTDPAELYRRGPGLNREGQKRTGYYQHEDQWIKVSLPANRNGILTQASVLTLTSNPTGTSPVKRGKWILENLLGDPPPPAPPNVPTLEETQKEHGNLSLREQLAIHRANPSCASCHDVMDPLGLAFENFDAIGQWRDRDGETPIDATGILSDGTKFTGSMELVQLLMARRSEFYRFFAEKLLTYALGRGLEPYDNCAIKFILTTAAEHNYSMRGFVIGVVSSQPFTQRRPDQ